ncbi:uncharacterized protein LOC142330961 [Lycorma delicatula]|uniref:uncharacterized protein LOC142330961 n=1 Tax=Lycorma delicatula TaxID=130591 RepID=UPI003F50F08D
MEVPIKRRHNRNSCLLCSGGNRNNQRVSRWRKVSASSSHRTRTETESSYGGAPGEGESPIMLPWQTKGGLEGVNSIDSSSTDVTSIAQRSVSDNLKSRSMVRRDVLKFVEQLSNPVLYKTCKQALLHLKQTYSDVFQDVCVYCDVYNIMSSTSHRIRSRRFLQELFLDIPFTEVIIDKLTITASTKNCKRCVNNSVYDGIIKQKSSECNCANGDVRTENLVKDISSENELPQQKGKKLVCEYCNERFRCKCYLKRDINFHAKEKENNSYSCQKSLILENKLKTQLIKHNER